MILKEGTSCEELMEFLEKMESLTETDSLVRRDQRIQVNCVKENGRLKNWTLSSDMEFKTKPYSMGKTLRQFKKQLEELHTEKKMFEFPDCFILCRLSTKISRNWDGRILSTWIKIDPAMPYQIKNGLPVFNTMEVAMTENEYATMNTIGLAFYNETTDTYYPFTTTAYASMGRLFDCSMAFKNVDQHLLGTALLLSEKISKAKFLRILHRHKNQHVKPVLSVVGKNYEIVSQKDFFESAMAYGAVKLGIYQVKEWSITDEKTSLTLEYPEIHDGFHFELELSIGDAPSNPISAILKAVIVGIPFPISRRTLPHKGHVKETDIKEMMKGLDTELDAFCRRYEQFRHRDCNFDVRWLNEIQKALGKKRVKALEPIPSGIYNADDLFQRVLTTYYVKIPERQMSDLENGFFHLFKTISEKFIRED